MQDTKCFLCGTDATCSETQGIFVRFYCEGSCGRYVVSRAAMRQIESSASSQTLKQSWSKEAALAQKKEMILFLHLDDQRQLKAERISRDDKLWSETPW